jgi:hypothetical protein
MDISSLLGSVPLGVQLVVGLSIAFRMSSAALVNIAKSRSIWLNTTAKNKTSDPTANEISPTNSHREMKAERSRIILGEFSRMLALTTLVLIAWGSPMPIDSRLVAILLLSTALAVSR